MRWGYLHGEKRMKILVTGGAGYIGSHTVVSLLTDGHEVVVFDNLSTGFRKAVLPPARLVVGDLKDQNKVDNLLAREKFEAIIHFAASIVVPESVTNPLKYYLNNTANSSYLIKAALQRNIKYFIFSSTAAVYGLAEELPVSEKAALNPINPYGRSKLMTEWVLQDTGAAHLGFKYIILRYFNVAGADPQGRIGQSTPEATHLIKVTCQTALGQRKHLKIFGTDYPTPDGTGIRDYIHVSDLAQAHVQALDFLKQGNPSEIFNCGYGHGYSVKEIVRAVEKISNKKIPIQETGRRAGDPAELVADSSRIKSKLQWTPKYNNLQFIVKTAYEWEKNRTY